MTHRMARSKSGKIQRLFAIVTLIAVALIVYTDR